MKRAYGLAAVLSAASFVSAGAASFQGLGDFPGGTFESKAYEISGNGEVVVGASVYALAGGDAPLQRAFRWTSAAGLQPVTVGGNVSFSESYAVNFDGSVIGVVTNNGSVLWRNGVVVPLAPLPTHTATTAFGISNDGAKVVGVSSNDQTMMFLPALWTAPAYAPTNLLTPNAFMAAAEAISGDGATVVGVALMQGPGGGDLDFYGFRKVGAGPLEAITPPGGGAAAASNDGKIVVGTVSFPGGDQVAYKWVEAVGFQGLQGVADALNTFATDVSADGSVVVGSNETFDDQVATIWVGNERAKDIKKLLETEYNLNLTGWRLIEAISVSADGKVIVGNGINPNGNQEAWIARLDGGPAPIPGDTDASGCVDDADLTNMILDFGAAGGSSSGFPGTDVNSDGVVDDADLTDLILSFGAGC